MRARPSRVAEAATVRAPLLAEALAGLAKDKRCVVIDLGPIRPTTLAFFSGFACRLDVVDVERTVLARIAPPAKDDLDRSEPCPRTLRLSTGEPANLMLCWTLLNYFSKARIDSLVQPLVKRLTLGGQIHMLIESSAADMPATPDPLAVESDGSLCWPSPAPGARCPSPRHSSECLLACFTGFRLERTLLLGNGYKELLLTREALNNYARSAFQSKMPQIVWCDMSDSSHSYGRVAQRARCGFSGETQ
jgi:hypothetical protein